MSKHGYTILECPALTFSIRSSSGISLRQPSPIKFRNSLRESGTARRQRCCQQSQTHFDLPLNDPMLP